MTEVLHGTADTGVPPAPLDGSGFCRQATAAEGLRPGPSADPPHPGDVRAGQCRSHRWLRPTGSSARRGEQSRTAPVGGAVRTTPSSDVARRPGARGAARRCGRLRRRGLLLRGG